MNKLFLFLFILIFSSCDNRVTIIEEEEIELYYTSISVCDCYKSGMSTLSNLIEHKDDVYKILFQELNDLSFTHDLEIVILANKKNFSIHELPVTWTHKKGSKLNIFFDPIRMFFKILLLRYNLYLN